ncbi:MAG: guanylate kinase [bacterium]
MHNTAVSITATTYGSLIILAGPSGVGKNAVYSGAAAQLGDIYRSVSATTRAPRSAEVDGIDYLFISEDEYDLMLERDEFLEHAGVHGNRYGTPRQPVLEHLAQGIDVVLEIDVQGMHKVRRERPDVVKIFLAPPSMPELERRLRERGTETDAAIIKRLRNARKEIEHIPEFDFLIINDDLDIAVEKFTTIVGAVRLNPRRLDQDRLQRGLLNG